jgi:predicted nucleic acid-binding protein
LSRAVLDASAVLSWLIPAQSTSSAYRFLAESSDAAFAAPAVFELEVRNSLLRLERQGRIGADRYDSALLELELLDLSFEAAIDRARNVSLAALARRERISLFDAHYLDLALLRGASLASRDRGLLSAARRHGVPVHDLRDDPDDDAD